jgi:hypothetical protein
MDDHALHLAVNEPPTGPTRVRSRTLIIETLHSVFRDVRRRREAAQAEDAIQLDRLAAVLPLAAAIGVTTVDVARESGVSRPTLNSLRSPRRHRWPDAELAVLAGIAIHGPLDTDELAERMGAELIFGEHDVHAAVHILGLTGLISPARTDYSGDSISHAYRLTQRGEEALVARLHRAGIHDEFAWSAYVAVDRAEAQALERAGSELLGTHEVSILYPGQGQNATWEVAFRVPAATADDAMSEARRTMEVLRTTAGLPQQPIVANLSLIAPRRA